MYKTILFMSVTIINCIGFSFFPDNSKAEEINLEKTDLKTHSEKATLSSTNDHNFIFRAAEILVDDNSNSINYPYIEGVVNLDLFYDGTFKASDSDEEVSDLFTEIKLNANTFFDPNIYLNTVIIFKPVFDQKLGENRWFGDHGVSVSALNLNYESDRFFVGVGKGSVNFAIASNAVGIWGADIVDDQIKVGGRLGIAGDIGFSLGDWGNHAVSASFFFADTTFLSESLITNRGRKRREDGGVSNTGVPESFAIALDGNNFKPMPNLRYHLAFMRQAVEKVKINGEFLSDKMIND